MRDKKFGDALLTALAICVMLSGQAWSLNLSEDATDYARSMEIEAQLLA